MKRVILAIVVLVLASLACATGSGTPKPSLYPSNTPEITQTPYVMEITTTAEPPVIVIVSATPNEAETLCVEATVAVHLRPSPSNDNYPVAVLVNGTEVKDLGGRSGKWMFVQAGDKQGWIFGDFVGGCDD